MVMGFKIALVEFKHGMLKSGARNCENAGAVVVVRVSLERHGEANDGQPAVEQRHVPLKKENTRIKQ